MLCAAVCPTEAITVERYNLNRTLGELLIADKPVLACSLKDGLMAHSSGPCLGFLSPEHLVSIPVLIDKTLQLNLSECSDCENTHISEFLKESIAEMEIEGVVLVDSVNELDYHDIQTGRRDFFRMLRREPFQAAHEFTSSLTGGGTRKSYSEKSLPMKRRLLNAAYRAGSVTSKKKLQKLYSHIAFHKDCNGCSACTAMCPTGALSKPNGKLYFNTFSCVGCELCEEFCPKQSIYIIPIKEHQTHALEVCVGDKNDQCER
ncbi:MAG: 4Fe-4S binding protein [Thermodesulfovibrionales bacterium]|nr:4Fe-4S binding protein [Thermodesulfovibrionales bacterium]